MTSGIYCITCSCTGDCYIGFSTQLEKRWRTHQQQLINGKHSNSGLLALHKEYGLSSLSFEILERCPDSYTESHLQALERQWFEKIRPSLNRRLPYACEFNEQISRRMKDWWSKQKAQGGVEQT